MKKYDVTMTAHYEKRIFVFADSPEDARRKMEAILRDTNLIVFEDDDFVGGESDIKESPDDFWSEPKREKDRRKKINDMYCPYFQPDDSGYLSDGDGSKDGFSLDSSPCHQRKEECVHEGGD